MARPRGYERQDVVEAAKDAFWENGYEGTAVSDLERRTGLNRSSLYVAFGSKRELFAEALDSYAEDVTGPLIGELEAGPDGLDAITTFFSRVKAVILDQQDQDKRGCLMVNTIAELSARDEEGTRLAATFHARLSGAFARALERAAKANEIDGASIPRRARMLTAVTLGVWLSARIDLLDAAALCGAIASEMEDWR